jgi:hypothetical protein
MMFNIFFGGESAEAAGSGERTVNNPGGHGKAWTRIGLSGQIGQTGLSINPLWALLAVLVIAGCRTAPRPMAQVNLTEPGWQVHEGQAVWRLPLTAPGRLAKAKPGEREIAGDLLVATRPDGQAFVQFSKTPFPLVIAQSTPHRWAVEFPPQNKHYAGRGKPPQRVIWLYLPRALTGQPPPRHWSWHEDANGWRLEDRATGESVKGYFSS